MSEGEEKVITPTIVELQNEAAVEDVDDDVPVAPRGHVPPFHTAHDLLFATVPARFNFADEKLKTLLLGSVQFNIDQGRDAEKVSLQISAGEIKVSEGALPAADCEIALSGQDLLRIARGELNPQLSMLAGKVKAQGKLSLAIYFFNLVYPRGARN